MFTHQLIKRWSLLAIIPLLGLALLAACQPATQTLEVTRVVTETVVQEGQPVEVTRVTAWPWPRTTTRGRAPSR